MTTSPMEQAVIAVALARKPLNEEEMATAMCSPEAYAEAVTGRVVDLLNAVLDKLEVGT